QVRRPPAGGYEIRPIACFLLPCFSRALRAARTTPESATVRTSIGSVMAKYGRFLNLGACFGSKADSTILASGMCGKLPLAQLSISLSYSPSPELACPQL